MIKNNSEITNIMDYFVNEINSMMDDKITNGEIPIGEIPIVNRIYKMNVLGKTVNPYLVRMGNGKRKTVSQAVKESGPNLSIPMILMCFGHFYTLLCERLNVMCVSSIYAKYKPSIGELHVSQDAQSCEITMSQNGDKVKSIKCRLSDTGKKIILDLHGNEKGCDFSEFVKTRTAKNVLCKYFYINCCFPTLKILSELVREGKINRRVAQLIVICMYASTNLDFTISKLDKLIFA